jgi:hypothetical protein
VIRFDSLVVSVPATALGNVPLPGSVFKLAELMKMPLARDLTLALEVVAASCPRAGAETLCVARPEMFTHGPSLAWLSERLGGATDHLNFSDGHTLKLIPTLRNHLFTYGLQSRENRDAFRRLMRWAPELLGQIEVQLNSFHRVANVAGRSEPFPAALLAAQPTLVGMVWRYGFYLNPHSAQDSCNQSLSWGELASTALPAFEGYTYLVLTDCALQQAGFVRMLAARIERAYFDPGECLLLRLPTGESALSPRLTAVLEAILATGVLLPRTKARNILWLSGDLPEATLKGWGSRLSLVLPQSSDFWRFTRSLYAEAGTIQVFLDKEWQTPSDTAAGFVTAAFGRSAQLHLSARVPRHRGATP